MQEFDQRSTGSRSSSSVDYSTVEFPDKPRTEWHYTQRRAELLQLVKETGHPGDLNQTELAEEYGVSQQQISKDLKRLGEYVRENLTDRNRWALTIDSTINRAIRGMLDNGEYRQAARTAMEYDAWLNERAPELEIIVEDGSSETIDELVELFEELD